MTTRRPTGTTGFGSHSLLLNLTAEIQCVWKNLVFMKNDTEEGKPLNDTREGWNALYLMHFPLWPQLL